MRYFIATEVHPDNIGGSSVREDDPYPLIFKCDKVNKHDQTLWKYMSNLHEYLPEIKYLIENKGNWVKDYQYKIGLLSNNTYILYYKERLDNDTIRWDPLYYMREMTETEQIVEFM